MPIIGNARVSCRIVKARSTSRGQVLVCTSCGLRVDELRAKAAAGELDPECIAALASAPSVGAPSPEGPGVDRAERAGLVRG